MEALRQLKLDTAEARTDVCEVLTAVIQYPGEETADEIQALLNKNQNDLVALCTEHPNAYDPEDKENHNFTLLFNNVQQLTRRRDDLLRRIQADANAEQRMAEIMELLYDDKLDVSEYDDTLVRKLIESITVVSGDTLKIVLKNGITMTSALMNEN